MENLPVQVLFRLSVKTQSNTNKNLPYNNFIYKQLFILFHTENIYKWTFMSFFFVLELNYSWEIDIYEKNKKI